MSGFVGFFQGLDNLVFGGGTRVASNASTQAAQQAGRSWFRPDNEAADTFVRNSVAHIEAVPVQQQVHAEWFDNLAGKKQKSSEENFITSGLMALTVAIAAVGAGLHIAPVMAAAALVPASGYLGKGLLENQIGQFLKTIKPDAIGKVALNTQDELFKTSAQEFLVKHAQKLGIQIGTG